MRLEFEFDSDRKFSWKPLILQMPEKMTEFLVDKETTVVSLKLSNFLPFGSRYGLVLLNRAF